MTVSIKPLERADLEQLNTLFSCSEASDRCRCMWFIKSVKTYHADGPNGNWADFKELAQSDTEALGLIAIADGQAVGWCALGPRFRFARGIKAPSFKGRDPSEDDSAWLLPCLFVAPSFRGKGLTALLIEKAVLHARSRGATCLEAFPYVGTKRWSKDVRIGFSPQFEAHGFVERRRPSPNRSVMRLDFM